MALRPSLYLTVNVPYVHRLPQYRPQLEVSLPLEDDANILVCCVLSENLTQFNFGELPHHPLVINIAMILYNLISRYRVDLNQVSVEARQLPHLYLAIHPPENFQFRYLRITGLICVATQS
jgi:hypothetical protein